jgi:Bardet-Biedl syndrome 7 protein
LFRIVTTDAHCYFKNCFSGTHLVCSYRKDEAIFKSESVATLSILKQFVTKEATTRNTKININLTIKDETINDVLNMMHPKVDYQLAIAKKVKLIEALQELKQQEADISFLAPEYLETIDNVDKIQVQFKQQPRELDFIYHILNNILF